MVECRVKKGEENLGWKKFGGNSTTISADSVSVSLNSFFFCSVSCSLGNIVHRNMNIVESNRARKASSIFHESTYQITVALWPSSHTALTEYQRVWWSVVMDWRRVVMHTILTLHLRVTSNLFCTKDDMCRIHNQLLLVYYVLQGQYMLRYFERSSSGCKIAFGFVFRFDFQFWRSSYVGRDPFHVSLPSPSWPSKTVISLNMAIGRLKIFVSEISIRSIYQIPVGPTQGE